MRHFVKGLSEVSVEGHIFGVCIMYLFERGQHVRRKRYVLHKPVLMIGKIDGEVVVESYVDAFFKNFAFDVQ